MLRRKSKHAAADEAPEQQVVAESVESTTEAEDTLADERENSEVAEATPVTKNATAFDAATQTDNKVKKPRASLKSKLAPFAPKNIKGTIRRHPRRSMAVGAVLAVLLILLIIPTSRNKALGLVIKKPVDVQVFN